MKPLHLILLATATLLASGVGADANTTTTKNSFSLSGSGGMLVWHLGVAQVRERRASAGATEREREKKRILHPCFQTPPLQALLDYRAVTDATAIAGISGGAITATLLASGVSPKEAAAKLVPLMVATVVFEGVTGGGGGGGTNPARPDFNKMAGLLRASLRELLPGNAASQANGKLHVFASQVSPASPSLLSPPPLWFDLGAWPGGYGDKGDLIDATVASAYVPCAVGGASATPYKDHLWIDGGAAASLDNLCGAISGSAPCVEVVAVAVGPLAAATCSPPPAPEGSNNAGTYPGYPTYGGASTAALPLDCGAYKLLNGRSATEDFHPLKVVAPPGAICPGCRVQTPFTQCDIKKFANFQFGGLGQAWDVHQLGYKEGEAWAVEQGLTKGG